MKKTGTHMDDRFWKKMRGIIKLVAGIIMLIISVPLFIFYQLFPALNTQVGPNQIASWIAVTLSFFGFVSIIIGAGELEI